MDKRITRMANSGVTSVVMFGKVWELTPGTWGVRIPKKTGKPRLRISPSLIAGLPDMTFAPGKPVPDFSKAEVYKIDDARYVDPRKVGGMCIKYEDYLVTRMLR